MPRQSTIPAAFRSSKAVGAHFGLTPKKYQSGETDVTGRISKIGDGGVRTALYEAANVILTRPVKGSTLKSWGMRLAARAGMRKAKVALARKLAVVLTVCWPTASPSSPTKRLRLQPTNKGDSRFGRFETPAARSKVPSPGRWIRSGRSHLSRASLLRVFRLADLLLIQPHQVAAQRRPRTEERPRAIGSRLRGIDHPTARDRRDDTHLQN
jgi:hypothetical protein